MKLAALWLSLATALVTLAQNAAAWPAYQWRSYSKADGLPENACLSITLGTSGNVLVRHPGTNGISILDGYAIRTLPGYGTNRARVYESPGGQLWSTAAEGLIEFRNDGWALHPLPELAEHFDADPTNEISLLPVRQGRVLILLPDRLLQFDAENVQHESVQLLKRAEATALGSFAKMAVASDGGLWVFGSRGAAKVSGPLRNLKAGDNWIVTNIGPTTIEASAELPPDEKPAPHVFDEVIEPGGALWLATAEGLFRRSPAIWAAPVESASLSKTNDTPAGQGLPMFNVPLPDGYESPDFWHAFLTARDGDIWLGGAQDIAWLHRGTWKLFTSTNQLGPENIMAFAEAPDGRIWCATLDRVWEFDGRNWLALRGGFDHINGLCGARDGTLWLATENGIHRLTRGSWIANGVEDGLPSVIVRSVWENDSGEVVAETSAGLSVFRPDADGDAPDTFIHPFARNKDRFGEGETINVRFGGGDKWKLTSPERLLFSHRLDEREWSPFQDAEEILFADLPAGRHYFQVRAMDRNGNVDPAPARLELLVVLPWYKETRLVVILAMALIVALLLAGVAFNRHRHLLKSYAFVEEQVVTRTRELENANRELLHSQKMNALGTLAAGIAHDFNNILSIIKGSAQIIEENADNKEKLRTRVDRIKTVVEQGSGIVNAMLGFSNGSGERAADCDLNAVVGDTIKLLGDRFLREVEIEFRPAADLAQVSCARDFVQQILLNFIFNAAEAMAEQKRVTITTSQPSKLPSGLVVKPAQSLEYVSVSVRDTGCGIAPENLPRIFEPFFTTKALSTRRGTGLGLSMVYELARKLEAGLAVESVAGKGSTFTLILPVRISHSKSQESQHAAVSC